jgi:hypothetical protein
MLNIGVAEGLAEQSLGQSLRIETRAAEYGACVFCRFFKGERFNLAFVVERRAGSAKLRMPEK